LLYPHNPLTSNTHLHSPTPLRSLHHPNAPTTSINHPLHPTHFFSHTLPITTAMTQHSPNSLRTLTLPQQHRLLTTLLLLLLFYYIFTLRNLALKTPSIYSSPWPKPPSPSTLFNPGSSDPTPTPTPTMTDPATVENLNTSAMDTENTATETTELVALHFWRILKRSLLEGMAGVLLGREVVAVEKVMGGRYGKERDRGWERLGWGAVGVGLVVGGWGAVVR
ncbi:hypothetical protein EX30DRAFT_384528, partial [Ascodesmis nigricans]